MSPAVYIPGKSCRLCKASSRQAKVKDDLCWLCRHLPPSGTRKVPRLILVAACSHEKFRYWCRENRINPFDRNVRHVQYPHAFRGYHGVPLYVAGDWFASDSLYLAAEEYCNQNNLEFHDLPTCLP